MFPCIKKPYQDNARRNSCLIIFKILTIIILIFSACSIIRQPIKPIKSPKQTATPTPTQPIPKTTPVDNRPIAQPPLTKPRPSDMIQRPKPNDSYESGQSHLLGGEMRLCAPWVSDCPPENMVKFAN